MLEEKKSTHRADVYDFKMEKHPNPEANFLSVVYFDDYTCVVKTSDWDGVKKCVHIQEDSVVDLTRPEFAFLIPLAKPGATEYRVRAKKLKGVSSFGFLIPVPDDAVVGEDWSEKLGVKRYIPKANNKRTGFFGGESESPPEGINYLKYDLENGRKYGSKVFHDLEEVLVFEKIHGSQGGYVFTNGRMYCRSKNEYKKEFPSLDHLTLEYLIEKAGEEKGRQVYERIQKEKENPKKNLWWQVLENEPSIEKFCRANPDTILFGEVTNVQGKGWEYGMEPGKHGFVAFDVFKGRSFLDYDDALPLLKEFNVPVVPLLYRGVYDGKLISGFAEGKTVFGKGKGIREGVVARPAKERYSERFGRAVLKYVGVGYLEKDQPEESSSEEE